MERFTSSNVTGFSASTKAFERVDLPRRRYNDEILANFSWATSQLDDMAAAAPLLRMGFVNGVLYCVLNAAAKSRFARRRGRFRQLA
jgi:hypothetical protein